MSVFNEGRRTVACRVRLTAAIAVLCGFEAVGGSVVQNTQNNSRPRARDLGITVGVLPTGPLNAITDVAGVAVGQTTIVRGDDVRTGVTAILPHRANVFMEKVPGAVFVGNGFGKLMGSTQVEELGEIETPILLTSTLNVPLVADALLDYMLSLPGNQDVLSVNPVVAETNDGYLNDIRGRHVHKDDVLSAIKAARGGPVDEGSVGAGTGTVAFGFKGGIGTASRRLPASLGGYTIGVLVQTNFGGVLTITGAPVGVELGKYYLKDQVSLKSSGSSGSLESSESSEGSGSSKSSRRAESSGRGSSSESPRSSELDKLHELSKLSGPSKLSEPSRLSEPSSPDGSVIIVVATDAPLDARNLRRMAQRAIMGLARTGAAGSNGSGDYAIAFSTAAEARITARGNGPVRHTTLLSNDAMSPLFLGVIEATEEAIYNSLFRATSVTGRGHTVDAIPIERTVEILKKYGVIKAPRR